MRKILRLFLIMTILIPCVAMAAGQETTRISRIGLLTGSPSASGPALEMFREGLRDLGWIEGKNVTIEYRYGEGSNRRVPQLAAELVALKVDVIVVGGATPALAAKKMTAAIPIVMTYAGDPVGTGLVASLARPGGNITGLSSLSDELSTKRLELLK